MRFGFSHRPIQPLQRSIELYQYAEELGFDYAWVPDQQFYQDPFACLVEICANDELRTVLWPMPKDNDPDSWALRQETWQHEDVLLGGSDAGAHLDRMCGAPYTTRFLGDCLRGRRHTNQRQGERQSDRHRHGSHYDLASPAPGSKSPIS